MKRFAAALALAAFLAPASSLFAQQSAPQSAPSAADLSYAVGVAIGSNLKNMGLSMDYATFLSAVKDVMEGKATRMTTASANEIIQAGISDAKKRRSSDNAKKSADYLANNAKRPGVKVLADGLQFEVVKAGSGASPSGTDSVKINYTGTLVDGTVFDTNKTRGEAAVFPISGVIPGFSEGLGLMQVGGTYRLHIPAALAYGDQGAGDAVGPACAIVFEVELLGIVKK